MEQHASDRGFPSIRGSTWKEERERACLKLLLKEAHLPKEKNEEEKKVVPILEKTALDGKGKRNLKKKKRHLPMGIERTSFTPDRKGTLWKGSPSLGGDVMLHSGGKGRGEKIKKERRADKPHTKRSIEEGHCLLCQGKKGGERSDDPYSRQELTIHVRERKRTRGQRLFRAENFSRPGEK